MEQLRQDLKEEKQQRKTAMRLRAAMIGGHHSAETPPHPHGAPLLHTERGNSSQSYMERFSNAALLTRNPAARDRAPEHVIRQMEQDSRAISYISGRIRQLEDLLALPRPPGTSATGPGHGSNRDGLPDTRGLSAQQPAPRPLPAGRPAGGVIHTTQDRDHPPADLHQTAQAVTTAPLPLKTGAANAATPDGQLGRPGMPSLQRADTSAKQVSSNPRPHHSSPADPLHPPPGLGQVARDQASVPGPGARASHHQDDSGTGANRRPSISRVTRQSRPSTADQAAALAAPAATWRPRARTPQTALATRPRPGQPRAGPGGRPAQPDPSHLPAPTDPARRGSHKVSTSY